MLSDSMLVCVALSEYIGSRAHGNAEDYIKRRYPVEDYPDMAPGSDSYYRKLNEVRKNLIRARELHQILASRQPLNLKPEG